MTVGDRAGARGELDPAPPRCGRRSAASPGSAGRSTMRSARRATRRCGRGARTPGRDARAVPAGPRRRRSSVVTCDPSGTARTVRTPKREPTGAATALRIDGDRSDHCGSSRSPSTATAYRSETTRCRASPVQERLTGVLRRVPAGERPAGAAHQHDIAAGTHEGELVGAGPPRRRRRRALGRASARGAASRREQLHRVPREERDPRRTSRRPARRATSSRA